ncbi:hypothetical protein BDF20DRAFT_853599 [Mycotypha africana]|uniref:uncharacterized protein n=1 Tax=Mycotypha africana TaxID=64632 RepID=UPI0023014BDC|nr:uncharacterized protein BDF20DRAFT_853599 [Mycotypha africana]KAI8988054.1 hypothetical protein BDF20DRAFT_853599 [Mycotypha africana]
MSLNALRRPFSRLFLQQRSLYTTEAVSKVQNGETTNHAALLANKFITHAKFQRQQAYIATPFVSIQHIPPTATLEDIYKLAREAFPEGDKAVKEIIFCRNQYFNLNGRCIVSMASSEDATRFIHYGNNRTLGGSILKMNYTKDVTNDFRRPELTSITDSTNFSGRSVVITGFPKTASGGTVLGHLRARNFFPIEGIEDNIVQLKTNPQSMVSKFLIKFGSESEAWRCVRTFHNTYFLLRDKDLKLKLHVNVAY